MRAEQLELIGYRLSRADETLSEAQVLFDNGYTVGVVNRVYYACFYAVSALLLTEDLASSKHSGVMSLFNQHWVKKRRVPDEMGAFYNRLYERRQSGDYKDIVSFDREDVGKWLGEAKLFVEHISDWVARNVTVD
jgi:uncharacterized protein